MRGQTVTRILCEGEDIPIVESSSADESNDDEEVTLKPSNRPQAIEALPSPSPAKGVRKRLRLSDGATSLTPDDCQPPPAKAARYDAVSDEEIVTPTAKKAKKATRSRTPGRPKSLKKRVKSKAKGNGVIADSDEDDNNAEQSDD